MRGFSRRPIRARRADMYVSVCELCFFSLVYGWFLFYSIEDEKLINTLLLSRDSAGRMAWDGMADGGERLQ